MSATFKRLIPNVVLQTARRWLHGDPTPKEAFERIYRDGTWGKSADALDPFYLGAGSHMPGIVPVYVNAVEEFLRSLGGKPDAVDLGCGDFAVGSKLRPLCRRYVACDVVEPLILRNRQKFAALDVDFQLVDITADVLPAGDVVFIRQVLQHLSNRHIQSVVDKLLQYRYVVLTEHLPSSPAFEPNLDKAVGAGTRLGIGRSGSGVVLTRAPFNLRAVETRMLCEVSEGTSVIRTEVYRLR